jgi:hypothetical protein
VLIEVDSSFFDRIECNPVPPYGRFALFAGKLDGCVSMVFVTIIVIRAKNLACHFLPPFFQLPGLVTEFKNALIFGSDNSMAVCQIRTNCRHKIKKTCPDCLINCLKAGLAVNVYGLSPLPVSPFAGQR